MIALLLGSLVLPAAVALLARVVPARHAPRLVSAATGIAAALGLVLVGLTVAGTAPAAATLELGSETPVVGVAATQLTTLLLLLVLGVSWVVQRFAERSLAGDSKAARFSILAGVLTTAAGATVTATTLLGLALAWSATTVALCALIALYRGFDAAEEGVRRTGLALAIGDAALWGAVLLLTAQLGPVLLSDLPGEAASLPTGAAVAAAILIAVAAAARSVQIPFHGWLPATLAAPTPVSALLHAGVVNAGAVLLLLTAPLLAVTPGVLWALVALGTATAMVGTVLMLARPDVKGALAQSTVAQMGFMIMTCGLGLWAAAVLHLAAHGAYKATRFLGSGGAVGEVSSVRAAGGIPHGPAPARTLAAIVIAGAPLAAAAAVLGLEAGGLLLLVFAWSTFALAGRGWLIADASARAVLTLVVASALLGPAYAFGVETVVHHLEPALPVTTDAAPPAWLLIPVLALLGLAPLAWTFGPADLRDRLYAWALTTGDGTRPFRGRRGDPTPAQTLVLDSEGSTL